MNATDCARATEPHSRTVRHTARLKLTARRPACCGTTGNIATISPVRIIGTSFAAAVRCASLPAAFQLKSNVLARDPPPDHPASATLFSDRYCRGGGVDVSSSQGRFQPGQLA